MNFKLLITLVLVCALLGNSDASWWAKIAAFFTKIVKFLFGQGTRNINSPTYNYYGNVYHGDVIQISSSGGHTLGLVQQPTSHSMLVDELGQIDLEMAVNHKVTSKKYESDLNQNSVIFEFTQNLEKYLHRSKKVDVLFESLELYVSKINSYNNLTVRKNAISMLSNNSNSLINILNDMHYMLVGNGGLFKLLLDRIVADHLVCTRDKSALQVLYALYGYMTFSEMKTLLVMKSAFDTLRNDTEDHFAQQYVRQSQELTTKIKHLYTSIKTTGKKVDRSLWTCDSPSKKIGTEYLGFTYFIQAQLERIPLHRKTCEVLNSVDATLIRDPKCKLNVKVTKRNCQGKYVNCQEIRNSHIEFCVTENHHRRYDYLIFKTNPTMPIKQCDERAVVIQHNSQCLDCLCYCDDNERADTERYISLDEQISDLGLNKVVTGLRFAKRNRVIALEIQQAEIGADGFIVNNTEQWIESTSSQKFTLTPSERTIGVDVLEGKSDHVVTGVRFVTNKNGVHLEARVTPFDKETGKLNAQLSTWINNERTREEISLYDVNSPLATNTTPMIVSTGSNFIQATHTSLEQDSAQTTIPFFDAREIKSSPLIPLQGVGIVYKTADSHFGGFLAPIIVIIDFSEYLNADDIFFSSKANKALYSVYILLVFSCSVLLHA